MARTADSSKPSNKATSRKIKRPAYKSFRLSKSLKHPAPALPASRTLIAQSTVRLWKEKKLFGGILAIYAVAQFLLVQGILATEFSTVADMFTQSLDNEYTGVTSGLALFAYLLGTSGQNVSAEGSVYQTLLLIIVSLALIWALRHVVAGKQVRIRDAYYKGMYPLIPFILILFVILLQLLPLLIGTWLYQTMIGAGIATTLVEQIFWLLIAGVFALLTVYMICSSLIALYISTLPDMTPMQALRSARGLVLHRRSSVFWRIFVLAFFVLAIVAIVVLPFIFLLPILAPYVFYFTGVVAVAIIHSYMYALYRELLADA